MLKWNEQKITIVTACDNAYVQHTAIFLKSLFAKNPDIKFRILILVPDSFIHHRSLERNLGSYCGSVEFLNINLSDTPAFKVSDHVTVATYFRLFLDKLVPASIDRIIYMDSDILICGALEELWATDLDGYPVAAAVDVVADEDLSVRKKIGLAPASHYLNAGVLLIDLCRWRNDKLGERALAFAIERPELMTYWDQCALNYVLDGRFKELAKVWNFQSGHLRRTGNGKLTADALREMRAAKIIHFTGALKPWLYLTDHPMKWLYWKFLRKTEWRDYHPPDRTGRNVLWRTREVLRRNLEGRSPTLLDAARRVRRLWRRSAG